ncbi:MAG TPA: type II toxin-antitoxin system VapB family antitoxin [Candidatus Acidoferrales bacterium]|jgi:antitoxin VapB|nr:type II toxin-antitoxin system VapB family antitoxin [Candidatus Acidoferrales bacterium]
MAMNIKNDETQKLARKLSDLTGESLTAAITEAVRERLERVQSEQGAGLVNRLLRIGKDCAAHLEGPSLTAEHGDILYDERGLPR